MKQRVRIQELEVIHWTESVIVPVKDEAGNVRKNSDGTDMMEQQVRHPILIYALGEDGNLYELSRGRWMAFPICEEFMHKPRANEKK